MSKLNEENKKLIRLFIDSECKNRWASLRDQYRKYLKNLTTKSDQSVSIKIPKWKYADEMFVRPYLRERDTVTNLEFDEKGETDKEEMLQAESEHDGPAEQEEQTPASAKNNFEYKPFRGTKHPRYQPETASAVLMKYLVERKDKQNHLLIPFTHF